MSKSKLIYLYTSIIIVFAIAVSARGLSCRTSNSPQVQTDMNPDEVLEDFEPFLPKLAELDSLQESLSCNIHYKAELISKEGARMAAWTDGIIGKPHTDIDVYIDTLTSGEHLFDGGSTIEISSNSIGGGTSLYKSMIARKHIVTASADRAIIYFSNVFDSDLRVGRPLQYGRHTIHISISAPSGTYSGDLLYTVMRRR
jgi:hypothetical protein